MRDLFHPSIPFRKRPNRAFKPNPTSHLDESATGDVPAKTTNSIPIPNTDVQLAPTLTNPDMILPHEETENSTSMGLWSDNSNAEQFASNDFKISSDLGLIISRTPFVYGAGTILSDIGEVTEAENIPSMTKSASIDKKVSRHSYSNSGKRSSLTNGSESYRYRVDLGNHRRRISNESAASVTSNKQTNFMFQDFKDDVSVDDSVFQGDDEESILNSDSDETVAPDRRDSWKEWDKYNFDECSSTILSRKAEQILQSAKKRLNSMEDNLNRARSSIIQRQSNSATSIRSINSLTRSTPSPSQSERRKSELLENIKKQRDSLSSSSSSGPFESRRSNDRTSSQSSLAASIISVGLQSQSRSKNGSPSSISGSERRLTDQKLSPVSYTHSKNISSSASLELLNENESKIDIPQRPDNRISEKDANYLGNIRVLTRSASSLQIRDIEDQVEGLKGRLSRLRNLAKDDSARRRSLQFFKTPTAISEDQDFNCSGKNYQNSEPITLLSSAAQPDGEKLSEPINDNQELGLELNDKENPFYDAVDSAKLSEFDKSLDDGENEVRPELIETDFENSLSKETTHSENTDDSENDDSPYYDATVSHEDREDAFDYEHFFLHSALGTIGHQRRVSLDSEGSVETTRGFQVLSSQNIITGESSGIHLRSVSTDTLSTMASFETAIEGPNDDDYFETNDIDDFAVQCFQSPQEPNHGSGFDRFSDQTIETHYIEDIKDLKTYSSRLKNKYKAFPQKSSINFVDPSQESGSKIGFFIASNIPKRRSCKASFYLHDTSGGSRFNSEIDQSSNLCCSSPHINRNEKKSLDLFPENIISNEDQNLVRRLLNSFGECVLGLQEADNIQDCRIWRRRLDAARRVLDGDEGAM
ncbi:hypothetical protein OnM2_029074 [Erysiphe neolycopersici]|uniref:Uncharacterized protein n=1 Tax=Erysiphe neolycopersici TaxID=212602 RepID=A0A420HZW3_9PEZI|nr:hypothetical protein OnM2_029074 [Erysiphe neolycopersici]